MLRTRTCTRTITMKDSYIEQEQVKKVTKTNTTIIKNRTMSKTEARTKTNTKTKKKMTVQMKNRDKDKNRYNNKGFITRFIKYKDMKRRETIYQEIEMFRIVIALDLF